MSTEKHKMKLYRQFATRAEEWICPTCGRRMILSAPPGYQRVLIKTGDRYALHHGDFARRWRLTGPAQQEARPEPNLSPLWLEALRSLDLGDLSGSAPPAD